VRGVFFFSPFLLGPHYGPSPTLVQEVRDVLVSIGEKDAAGYKVRELIEEVDTNKNGVIDWEEFLTVCDIFSLRVSLVTRPH